jgi:hypothetical protein
VEFKPFYKTHERRYSVYFDIFGEEEWKKLEAEYLAKQDELKKMQAQTIDFFQLGEMQPERDHNFQSEASRVGTYKNKKYRSASETGWISFEMKVNEQPADMVFEYSGSLRGTSAFDIFVNDRLLASENFINDKPEFVYQKYELADDLDIQSGMVIVRIVPKQQSSAGPVYSVRTVKRQQP